MTRLFVVVGLTLLAVVAAAVLQRRRPDPPSAPSFRAPSQLDLHDFRTRKASVGSTETQATIVLFSSETCNSCPLAWENIEGLASQTIEVVNVSVEDVPELHRRYRIDGVPTTVLANNDGVVVATFFGTVNSSELLTALEGLA